MRIYLVGQKIHKLTLNMPLTLMIQGLFGSFIHTLYTELTEHVYGACISKCNKCNVILISRCSFIPLKCSYKLCQLYVSNVSFSKIRITEVTNHLPCRGCLLRNTDTVRLRSAVQDKRLIEHHREITTAVFYLNTLSQLYIRARKRRDQTESDPF